jgi:TolB-like protein
MTESESVKNPSAIGLFIAEAKRRHVFRTAGLYAGGAFVVLQLADILMPSLGIEESAISYLLMIIAAGFPLALIAAWVIDISGDGIRVTPKIKADEKLNLAPGRLVDLVIVALALGVGYLYLERFVLPVQNSAEVNEVETLADEEPPEPSIAVLPFENLSALKENEYFAAGIHEDILNELSQIDKLIVTSRTTTLAYAGSTKSVPIIARELNVNYVMEGSIRRSGNRVRISVQLIDASRDKHIWSEGYERDLQDVFEVQRDVARQVSHALKVQFDIGGEAGESPTKSLMAYELFLEARALASTNEPDNVEKAIASYRQALAIDPDYSDAWAGLSIALQATSMFGKADQQTEEAHIAAEKALSLTPESWMANAAQAKVLGVTGDGSFAKAHAYFVQAVAINSNDGELLAEYGFNLWFSGRTEDAQEQFLNAYRRDPLSAEANLSRAMVARFDNEDLNAVKFH